MATKRVLVKKEPPKKDPLALQKNIWLAGHAATIALGTIYTLFYMIHRSQRWFPWSCYRIALLGAITSYVISLLQKWKGLSPSYYELLATENFQQLLIAFIWLFSRASAFKLLTFQVIALLQLADKFQVKPILKLEASILKVIAYSELVTIVVMLFDTLLFRGTSGFALVLYLAVYWLRVQFSPYTQILILQLCGMVEKKVPKSVQPRFEKFVTFVKRQNAAMKQ